MRRRADERITRQYRMREWGVFPEAPSRIEIVREVGRGAEGVTYEATFRGSRVAAKRLASGDPVRIVTGMRALTPSPTGLCVPFEVHPTGDGALWLLMDWVEGEDFVTHVRRDALVPAAGLAALPMAFGQALQPTGTSAFAPCSAAGLARLRRALSLLAVAIDALHAAGYVHRDLHPRNVRVRADETVAVLDLGTSPRIGDAPSPERLVGPVSHVAPELGDGTPVAASNDWYAVGVLLFEALTGDLPFFGSGRDVLVRKQSVPAPRASLLVGDVPADLDALCAALLATRAEERAGGVGCRGAVTSRTATP